MRGFSSLVVAALFSALTSFYSTVLAAEPVVLKPSSEWRLDYGTEKCRLARVFGEGDNRHLLFFETAGPSSTFDMTLAGPAFSKFRSLEDTDLHFAPGEKSRETQPFTGDVASFGRAIIYSSLWLGDRNENDEALILGDVSKGLPGIDTTLASGVERILVKQYGDPVIVETGNLKAPLNALNTCSHDLLREWGLDIERHRTAQSRPEWVNLHSVVAAIRESYPSKALRQGEQGIVRMRVIVGPDGSVEECHIEKATRNESLESPACKEMMKARFRPAIDSEGTPMRSYYMSNIVYKVEQRPNSAGSRIRR